MADTIIKDVSVMNTDSNIKNFVSSLLDNSKEDTNYSLHKLLYDEIYNYFVKNTNPTKVDYDMLEYLSPTKPITNKSLRDVIKYLLLYTYKANANEIENHKKINESLEQIKKQLTELYNIHKNPDLEPLPPSL